MYFFAELSESVDASAHFLCAHFQKNPRFPVPLYIGNIGNDSAPRTAFPDAWERFGSLAPNLEVASTTLRVLAGA